MSDGTQGENDYNPGFSGAAGAVGSISENKFVVAATLAAVALAGSAFLYGKHMRVAHTDYPHAVPEPEHAATRLVDEGGPDGRTTQDQAQARVRRRTDSQSLGDDVTGSSAGTVGSLSLSVVHDLDGSKEKSSRSKDRRRRGKDPLKEVLKSGKKLKAFNVPPTPSTSASDAPTSSLPRSTGVQTDSESLCSPSTSTAISSESAIIISPISSSDQWVRSSRSAGKRPERESSGTTKFSSESPFFYSLATPTPTPTLSSSRTVARALSPNPSYTSGRVRSSSRGSLTISEEDAAHSSSGMTSAGHSRLTSEVSQSAQFDFGDSSASSSHIGDGEEFAGLESDDAMGKLPAMVEEDGMEVMEGRTSTREGSSLHEGDAAVRPKHFHHPGAPEGVESRYLDEEAEDRHLNAAANTHRLSGSTTLSISDSRSHSPSPLRQSHIASVSRESTSLSNNPNMASLHPTSIPVGSEEADNEEDEPRIDSGERDDDARRTFAARPTNSQEGLRRQGMGAEPEDKEASGEFADRGRRLNKIEVVSLHKLKIQEGEDLEAISRKDVPYQEERSLQEGRPLRVANTPTGEIVVEEVRGGRLDLGRDMDAEAEEAPSPFSSSLPTAPATIPGQAAESGQDVYSDSSNMAAGLVLAESGGRTKKRVKKAATASQSSAGPRKLPPGAAGWDWDGAGSSTSTSSTPVAEKGRSSKTRPTSGSSSSSFSAIVASGSSSATNPPEGPMAEVQLTDDFSTTASSIPPVSSRRTSHIADLPTRSPKRGHRPTTPGMASRGKNGTPPPLSPLHPRPNSPGDGSLFALSEHTQLASLRGALEAARQREEKHKTEMERVVKESETLRQESMNLRRGEGELQAHVQHLMRQLHGYQALISGMGPPHQMFMQPLNASQVPLPPHLQSAPTQSDNPIEQDSLATDPVGAAVEQSETTSNDDATLETESGLNQADAQLAAAPVDEDEAPNDSDTTPSQPPYQEGQSNLPQHPTSPFPLSLPPHPGLSSPPGSSMPGFPSPMSPSFVPYPYPPQPFSSPPHPMMAHQFHWMQASWASHHYNQSHSNQFGPVPQSPGHQSMFSPPMMPMPYPPPQPGFPPATPSSNGSFHGSAVPNSLFYPSQPSRSANSTSAPGTSSAGSISPDLPTSPLAMSGRIQRPLNNRSRSQLSNLELGLSELRPASGGSIHDRDGEHGESTGSSTYSDLLADAILRRPGSIRELSSGSLRRGREDKEVGIKRSSSDESDEQLAEFTFPSISDLTSSFYRNSPRTESSMSSSLSSSPPSSTATVPDTVPDTKPGEGSNVLPTLHENVEIVDSTTSTTSPVEIVVQLFPSSEATPRKENCDHLPFHTSPHSTQDTNVSQNPLNH